MSANADLKVLAFSAETCVAHGALDEVLPLIHQAAASEGIQPLVFDSTTGKLVEIDLRGSLEETRSRLSRSPEEARRRPGRPRLGVVAREVTLLPRHWEWLAAQPGGASVALRKLVEGAIRTGEGPERARRSKEAAYRFITAMAGDRPGYEEAIRMLFAGDWTAFDAAVETWPADVREAARALAAGAWRNGAQV